MNLLTVALLDRRNWSDELSYFSLKDISLGSLVTVPIQGKVAKAIVIGSSPISDAKTEIRKASFAVKKIGSVKKEGFLSKNYLDAASKASSEEAKHIGDFLHDAIPSFFTEHPELFPENKTDRTLHEELVLQADTKTRISYYKTVIREEFAKKRSVLIACPTIQDVERCEEALKRGIEQFTFSLSSELSDRELKKKIKEIKEAAHPVVILSTPSFTFDWKGDAATLIIEKEESEYYKTVREPETDMRAWLALYGKHMWMKVIYGSFALSLPLIRRYENKEVVEAMRLSWRLYSDKAPEVIDMTKRDEHGSAIFSERALALLDRSVEKGERSILFVARKGLFTITVCTGCNTPLTCSSCDKPLVLHEKIERDTLTRYYLCHSCGNKTILDSRNEVLCRKCGNWRLALFGIGTEQVRKILEERYGKKLVFLLDSDIASSKEKAEKIIHEFYNTKGSILVGTERIFSFLKDPVSLTGIVSCDGLFAIPDYNANFKILSIAETLREYATERFFLQTRLPEEDICTIIGSGLLQELYRKELELRKMYQYPPFAIFVRFIPQKNTSSEWLSKLPALFDGIGTIAFYKVKTGQTAGLLRMHEEMWTKQETREKVRTLRTMFLVSINPTDIL